MCACGAICSWRTLPGTGVPATTMSVRRVAWNTEARLTIRRLFHGKTGNANLKHSAGTRFRLRDGAAGGSPGRRQLAGGIVRAHHDSLAGYTGAPDRAEFRRAVGG